MGSERSQEAEDVKVVGRQVRNHKQVLNQADFKTSGNQFAMEKRIVSILVRSLPIQNA